MANEKTTLNDVARKMGISKMTVSRAINHPEKVNHKTLDRILKTMKELDYKPKFVARVLAGRDSKTIGFFIKPNRDFVIPPFYGECVKGATDWLKILDYKTLLFNASEKNSKLLFLDYMNSGLIDGAVVFEGSYDEELLATFKNNNIPAVLVGEKINGPFKIPTISTDNYTGSRKAVSHLIDTGARKIVHLTGTGTKPSYRERIKGYTDVLEENGLSPRIIKTENTIEGGMPGMEILQESAGDFDALFCFSDLVAWGALKKCYDLSISVPGEIKIIGFDNISISQYMSPSLSTISQNMKEMARHAAGMLIQIISGKRPERNEITLDPELIIRESTQYPL